MNAVRSLMNAVRSLVTGDSSLGGGMPKMNSVRSFMSEDSLIRNAKAVWNVTPQGI